LPKESKWSKLKDEIVKEAMKTESEQLERCNLKHLPHFLDNDKIDDTKRNSVEQEKR